ncbi:MAG: DUF2961 domain-containing protein [Bacteroidales bacterium]|nr:DUF2961 domain-containing protein [Bacteroidales bacterium]
MIRLFLSLILMFLVLSSGGQALYDKPHDINTRWASAENWTGKKGGGGTANGGRKGSPSFRLNAGQTKTLAEVSGSSGIVRRIWLTIDQRTPEMLRGLQIEMYWDDASEPAVSAPLGDLFNHGLGQMSVFENALFSSPEGRSFNCCIPMPFKKSMRIVARNTTVKDVAMFFYEVDYTLGDKVTDNSLYFHAYYNHQQSTVLGADYQILPKVYGTGRYIGTNISVVADDNKYSNSWWGEGEVKIYIDGDTDYPTLCGTGTEDYIGTGWGQGVFVNQYQGCTIANEKGFEYAFYRFHIPDPVFFYNDIRVTIQQIGFAGKEAIEKLSNMKDPIYNAEEKMKPVDFSKDLSYILFERSDNVSSCAYFYLDKPGPSFEK